MPANTSPVFVLTPKFGSAQISTANTARDGTGTMGTILTAGANGSRVHRVVVKATVTTTAGMIRLFIYDGTNVRLYKEIFVSAITPSGTVLAWEYTLELFGERALLLPTTYELRAATNNAETFNVFAEGGDF